MMPGIWLNSPALPVAELEEQTMALALQAAKGSTYSVCISKPAVYHQMEIAGPAAYNFDLQIMFEILLAQDAHERITTFLEKRDLRGPTSLRKCDHASGDMALLHVFKCVINLSQFQPLRNQLV